MRDFCNLEHTCTRQHTKYNCINILKKANLIPFDSF